MYLRKCRRKVSGQNKDYWQLVESYRTERGPRQRVVAHLGGYEQPDNGPTLKAIFTYRGQVQEVLVKLTMGPDVFVGGR